MGATLTRTVPRPALLLAALVVASTAIAWVAAPQPAEGFCYNTSAMTIYYSGGFGAESYQTNGTCDNDTCYAGRTRTPPQMGCASTRHTRTFQLPRSSRIVATGTTSRSTTTTPHHGSGTAPRTQEETIAAATTPQARTEDTIRLPLTALILSAALAGAGCTTQGVSPNEGETPNPSVRSELHALFGSDIAAQFSDLQLLLDRAIEDDVADCMRHQGFAFIPRTTGELQANLDAVDRQPLLSSAHNALMLIEETSEPVDDITISLPRISDEAARAETDCYIEASNTHLNPLADDTSWWADAVEEASHRTRSDPQVLAAAGTSDACIARAGYGTYDEAVNTFYSEAEKALTRWTNNDITASEAITDLQQLEAAETAASADVAACLEPYLETQRSVYSSHIITISERDADRVAEWTRTVADIVTRYHRDYATR